MDICGHHHIREQLGRIAMRQHSPQSYLFAGPRRLGKFLVALEFARNLVAAEAGHGEDDILVLGRRAEIHPSDERVPAAVLSVTDIRRAETFLSRFPSVGRCRVVIIDEAERLTVSAENALLKVLEEPNSTAVIILVTHVPGTLLPTVRSRVLLFTFQPLLKKELLEFFTHTKLPDFFLSLGLPGLIAASQSNPKAFEYEKEVLRKLFQLTRLSWARRIELAEDLARDPDCIVDVLETWISGLAQKTDGHIRHIQVRMQFLESALETLDRITRKEGNSRLLLEKLFTLV